MRRNRKQRYWEVGKQASCRTTLLRHTCASASTDFNLLFEFNSDGPGCKSKAKQSEYVNSSYVEGQFVFYRYDQNMVKMVRMHKIAEW